MIHGPKWLRITDLKCRKNGKATIS